MKKFNWIETKEPGYFTDGEDDGQKPMYNQEEIDLLGQGYKVENEYRHRNSDERDHQITAELQQKFQNVKLVKSNSEFGWIHRFYVK